MVVSIFSTFSKVVTAGERIESNIKNGKFPNTIGALSGENKPYSNFHKRKEGDANSIVGSSKKNKSHYPLLLTYHQFVVITPAKY